MILINGEEFELKEDIKNNYKLAEDLSISDNTISIYCVKENKNDLILLIDLETHKYTYLPVKNIEQKNEYEIIKYFREEFIIFDNFSIFKIIYEKDAKLKVDINNNILYIYCNIFINENTFTFDQIKEKLQQTSKPTFNTYKINTKTNQNNSNKNILNNVNKQYIKNNDKEIKNIQEVEKILSQKNILIEQGDEIYENTILENDEKYNIINELLNINENTFIINAINKDCYFSIDKLNGKITKIKYNRLMNFKTQIENVEELMSFIKPNINTFEDIDDVVCCDIRMSYKYYKNKGMENEIVQQINYITDNNILYLSIVDEKIANQGLTIKQYSSEIYNNKELQFARRDIIQKLEKYGTKVFYIVFEDRISFIKSFIKEDTFEEIDVKEMYEATNNPNIKSIFELNSCFPVEHIINLAQYKINLFDKIKHSNKKIINMCDPKVVSEEDDELSYGFDRKSNTLFYFIDEF